VVNGQAKTAAFPQKPVHNSARWVTGVGIIINEFVKCVTISQQTVTEKRSSARDEANVWKLEKKGKMSETK